MDEQDLAYMQRALELAEQSRGWVEPNPLVGAVIVQNGQIVGMGRHERYGLAHAEVNALTQAGDAARGATLFVTLEPCCHQGKTGPCTQAIIRAGIRSVRAAMLDPFPAVSGQGLVELRRAGLQVDVGLCEQEARLLNSPYMKLVSRGRPYVHAKWAMSLDGKLASRSGDSKWISSGQARQLGHKLRGLVDAIIVGARTIRIDDPLLTARPPAPRTPTRIVITGTAAFSLESQVARTIDQAPLLVVASGPVNGSFSDPLRVRGGEVLELPGLEPPLLVSSLLDELGKRRMTNVLVEGGGTTLGSFLDAGEIDEVHAFVAPILIGSGVTPAAGRGIESIAQALRLDSWTMEVIEKDILVHGRIRK
jgi:diaminohydroxyphosphoribosylaminopyrimidine deaminase/5-amino-6-(5-phosphoribosylamino)uracil reductase